VKTMVPPATSAMSLAGLPMGHWECRRGRNVAEHRPQAVLVPADRRVHRAVSAFQVGIGHEACAAVTRR
jgi:hypothetical protein